MTISTRRFRIVAALDPSEYAPIVLQHAIDQAARHDLIDLHFVTVVATAGAIGDAKARLGALALEGLDALRTASTDWRSRLHVRVGKPAEEISNLAGEIAADLLVIGRFGLHPSRGYDSAADRVVALVACPTLVVGLGGHEVEAPPQCPRCVAVREESDGERWFCEAHTSDRVGLSLRLPASTSSIQGGPLL